MAAADGAGLRPIAAAAEPDELRLADALARIPEWAGREIAFAFVPGGLANSNWRLRVEGIEEPLIAKLPGHGTEAFIDRAAANDAAVKAANAGVAPAVHVYLPDLRVEISTFVADASTAGNADFQRPAARRNGLLALRAFHGVEALAVEKTLFDMIDEHLAQARELDAPAPPDIDRLLAEERRARAALLASGLDLVPCHNDTVAANFLVLPDDRVLLIDFDYAAMNDRGYELALWFGEMFFTPEQELELLEEYFGAVRPADVARLAVCKFLADVKWSTWAMIQSRISPIDFDFVKYGHWKHMRARIALADPRWEEHLRAL